MRSESGGAYDLPGPRVGAVPLSCGCLVGRADPGTPCAVALHQCAAFPWPSLRSSGAETVRHPAIPPPRASFQLAPWLEPGEPLTLAAHVVAQSNGFIFVGITSGFKSAGCATPCRRLLQALVSHLICPQHEHDGRRRSDEQ